MNPYTSLLSKFIQSARYNNQASREVIYEDARRTLVAHLSHDEKTSSEQLEAEMGRLDDAILTVEKTIDELDGGTDRTLDLGPEAVRRDPSMADTTSRGSPAGEGGAGHVGGGARSRAGFDLFPFHHHRISGAVFAVLKLASNPYFLIASLVAGVYVGLFSKPLTAMLTPVANIYIELLKMVLIPFMVSAIVVSLSRLLGSEAMKRHLGSVFGIFVSGLVLASTLGILVCIVTAPGGNISGSARQALGQVINHSAYAVDLEITLNDSDSKTSAPTKSLLDRIIPDNIFNALTAGENLKILFFAIAFGIGLGSLKATQGDGLRVALLSVYDVCTQLIAWVNTLLPLALCGMVAKQVATVGAAELLAMIKFTIGFGIAAMLVLAISILLIAWASGAGLVRTIRAAREPLLLAMATRSSITCIPSAMNSLTIGLGYDRSSVELLLPLGITLFRFGPVLYFAFTTIFVAQLYGISISPTGYLLALAGAVLTGLASAGTTGVLTISLLGIIFQPLGLPLEAALALLVTVDPVVDIFRTACIVIPNCAAVAVVYRGRNQPAQPSSLENVPIG